MINKEIWHSLVLTSFTLPVGKITCPENCPQEIVTQIDRIYEMGDVMRKAVEADNDQYYTVQEKLAQLEVRGWADLKCGAYKLEMCAYFFRVCGSFILLG